MKRIILLAFLGIFTQTVFAQRKALTDTETGKKMIVGRTTLEEVADQDGFEDLLIATEFDGTPALQEQLITDLKDVDITAFIGTWCSDSQQHFPDIIHVLQQAGYDESRVQIIGLDRDKKSDTGLEEKFKVLYVPTVIFERNGKELGRIVETPEPKLTQQIVNLVKQ